MYKYVLITAIASIFLYCGSLLEKRFEGALKRIMVIAAYALTALVFCVLAGIRGADVGTDVHYYVVPSFNLAQQSSFSDFFETGAYAKWMPLSKLLFWVVPNATHSLFWLLFVIHLVIVVPILISLRLVLKDNAWLGVVVFGVAFFPVSLNIMRQFMGMGFILMSYCFVRKRRPFLFLVLIAVAVLFHESCLLGLFIYPIWLLASGSFKGLRISPGVMGAACLAAVQIGYPALNVIASYLGRFGSYINGRVAEAGGGGLIELHYIVCICVILGVLYWVLLCNAGKKPSFPSELSGLAALVFFGAALFSFCLFSFQLFRLGVFYLLFAVLLVPMVCTALASRRSKAQFFAVAVALLVLFAQSYYGPGSHEVVPYVIDLSDKF